MGTVTKAGEPIETNGWTYLRIEGSPRERGEQYGRALANEIMSALDTADYLARWDTGENMEFFGEGARETFGELEAEYEEEIQGIVDGVRSESHRSTTPYGVPITRDVMVAWNGYLELVGYWWPQTSRQTAVPRPGRPQGGLERCSAFIATGSATQDGEIVMAHNTWDRFALGDNFNLILDIQPPAGQGHRVLMQAAPGYITSNMDWMVTSAGLMITETTIGSYKLDPVSGPGIKPEFLRSRKAAQYGTSLDRWREIICTGNNGGYANTWLVGDAHGGTIARLDLGLRHQGYEEKRDGYFGGFNVASDLRVRNQECSDPGAYSDIRGNGARRVRFDQLLGNGGKVDVERAKEIIADHHDVLQKKDAPGSRTICGHLDLDDARLGNHGRGPFYPSGANDGKVMDSDMARSMTFDARWGNSCGRAFVTKPFLESHRQYDWLDGWMKDRPSQPWTSFPPLVPPEH
ncbi:C45 family autoproteolytic acyltransferase/hydolase [Streptomyces sp. URMC 129]|uniref:C45 family autoproteolytic acyltransferase/hydolase n=1 Tax=Streptomyces sp. URMC 129 TaxID=3423407 RepID=UPI003F1E206B